MAWIYCVLYISLFQMSVQTLGMNRAPTLQRSVRSAYPKTNGSYKIINRYGKPFVNKRVPDGSVVFPGLTSRSGVDIGMQLPEECKRLGICEVAPPNYLDDLVDSVIEDYKNKNITTIFNQDYLEKEEHPLIAERIGPESENVELCPTETRLIYPRMARDDNNNWHRIVNSDKDLRQSYRVEICRYDFSGPVQDELSCSRIAIFEDGYSARCLQKYIHRNMVAINAAGQVEIKPFPTPSCCSCVARTV